MDFGGVPPLFLSFKLVWVSSTVNGDDIAYARSIYKRIGLVKSLPIHQVNCFSMQTKRIVMVWTLPLVIEYFTSNISEYAITSF
ncbi:MAG: hypothetical protein C4288_09365 [Leptolyngbya sp. ERB_1_1]